MDQRLKRNTLSYKTLRRNTGQTLGNTAFDNDVLVTASKAQVAKENTDKLEIFKMKV